MIAIMIWIIRMMIVMVMMIVMIPDDLLAKLFYHIALLFDLILTGHNLDVAALIFLRLPLHMFSLKFVSFLCNVDDAPFSCILTDHWKAILTVY